MNDIVDVVSSCPAKRTPWNKGKLIGAKPPLRPKHVWCIRTRLQVDGRLRDLAMFNLAIDSKLRGCDVVALKIEDVAPSGYSVDRATLRQLCYDPDNSGEESTMFATNAGVRIHYDV